MNLEERLAAAMRQDRPARAMPSELVDRIMAELPNRASRRPWRRSASLLAATVGVALLLTAGVWLGAMSGPPATSTNSPTPPTPTSSLTGYTPYQLAEGYGPAQVISTPADCAFLADDWLRRLCSLTLTPEWNSIDVAPMTQSSRVFIDPPWWAAFARATIDGDTSFCSDWITRTYMTLGRTGGSATPPNTTFAPLHPVAACIESLRSKAAAGSFTMTDQGAGPENGQVVIFAVSSSAAARAAQGVAPSFDPEGTCTLASRSMCDAVSAAVDTALGDRTSSVDELDVTAQLVGCPGFASDAPTPAPCPPPSGGTWIGGVIAGGGGSLPQVIVAFDIAEVGGQITLIEVPYHRP